MGWAALYWRGVCQGWEREILNNWVVRRNLAFKGGVGHVEWLDGD